MLDWVNLEFGRARLEGSVRCFDDWGRSVFALQLEGRDILYGEWKENWEEKRENELVLFSIKIISFGIKSKYSIGIPEAERQNFDSEQEILLLKMLLTELFSSVQATSHEFAFQSEKCKFTGIIYYKDGWISSI